MKKTLPLVIIAVLAAIFVIIGIFDHQTNKIHYNTSYVNGNTAGNLYNAGLFCESNGTIFFSNPDDDYRLYSMVERMAPEVIAEERRIYKGVSANVDFYSGFVYSMLDLPLELYTPMFAVARIVGWSAHRMEELINTDKIIRPAYKNVLEAAQYVPLHER